MAPEILPFRNLAGVAQLAEPAELALFAQSVTHIMAIRPQETLRFVQIRTKAGVAQSVEQRIRNAKVGGSIPLSGTKNTIKPVS